jgi:hypothetical protein
MDIELSYNWGRPMWWSWAAATFTHLPIYPFTFFYALLYALCALRSAILLHANYRPDINKIIKT